jgi:hypothetical protein
LFFFILALWYANTHILTFFRSGGVKHFDRKKELAKELVKLSGLIRGSVVHTHKKCGRSDCECARGVLHPFCYLSRSVPGGRNRIVYVKPEEEERFAAAVRMYDRAWTILDELSELNIKIIKGVKQ